MQRQKIFSVIFEITNLFYVDLKPLSLFSTVELFNNTKFYEVSTWGHIYFTYKNGTKRKGKKYREADSETHPFRIANNKGI